MDGRLQIIEIIGISFPTPLPFTKALRIAREGPSLYKTEIQPCYFDGKNLERNNIQFQFHEIDKTLCTVFS